MKIHIALALCTEMEKANWAKGGLIKASSTGKGCSTKTLGLVALPLLLHSVIPVDAV